jgi:hypothetical protein
MKAAKCSMCKISECGDSFHSPLSEQMCAGTGADSSADNESGIPYHEMIDHNEFRFASVGMAKASACTFNPDSPIENHTMRKRVCKKADISDPRKRIYGGFLMTRIRKPSQKSSYGSSFLWRDDFANHEKNHWRIRGNVQSGELLRYRRIFLFVYEEYTSLQKCACCLSSHPL